MPPVTIHYEQAVYGSFPFWDKGYAILARSTGCRDEWIADLRIACQRYGERPAGAAEAGGLLALKLPSGPWAIIGPCPQGSDDRGRPNALAFHALFLSGSDYRKAGAFPFDLAHHLCKDWTAETTALPSGTMILDHVPPAEPSPIDHPQAIQIASALAKGRRVALETSGPIEDLARQVWLALPLRRRAKLSVATWTFAVANRLDLLALPRLASETLDQSYVDLASFVTAPPRHRLTSYEIGGRILWLSLAIVAFTTLGLAWRGNPPHKLTPTPSSALAITNPIPLNRPPERTFSATPIQRKAIEEGLIALAERFGTLEPTLSASETDLDALMSRLRERLSYRDSSLTPQDIDAIKRLPEPARPLAWDAHIALFRPDRPLPSDFAQGPLDWQLRVLAWSFHLDSAGRPAEDIPRFLSESLSPPFPIHSSPIADRYPALKDYVRFLRRLPER